MSDGAFLSVDVEDCGLGIVAADLDRIFEPFFSTKGEDGAGLGLASVRDSMVAVGGHVSVASKAGTGTTFHTLWRTVSPSTSSVNEPAVP